VNVVHVIPSLSTATGGPPFSTVGSARALRSLGAKVEIVTTDLCSPPQSRVIERCAGISHFPPGSNDLEIAVVPLSHPYRLCYSKGLAGELVRHLADADIVHVQGLFLYPQFAAWRSAVQMHIPMVVSTHGALDPFLRTRGRSRKRLTDVLWQRKMLDDAGAIHVTSEAERAWVLEYGYRAPIRILPNIVALDDWLCSPSRSLEMASHESMVIAVHGRLSAKKGLDILIRAMPEITRRVPHASLKLIGPDVEGTGSQLMELSRFLGIEKHISVTGSCHGPELVEELRTASVWALPSYGENFGMAVAEAMGLGLPVLTTKEVHIAPDAAASSALVIADRTPEAFANTIVSLLLDARRRQEIGEAARRYVEQFQPAVLGPKYLEMYEQVVSQR
jgi:glycosyltransferase involved in cell wall biosynthesis